MKRGFTSRREATRWLTAQRAAVMRGEVVATRDTFAEYMDGWLVEHRPRLEPGTYADYEVHIRRRLKPFFGANMLSAITAEDVRRYVAAADRDDRAERQDDQQIARRAQRRARARRGGRPDRQERRRQQARCP